MAKQKRHETDYKGVYYIESKIRGTNKPDKIFYISFYKNGKRIEQKAGRQFQDNMTAAKANVIRGQCISGKRKTNTEIREAQKLQKEAERNKWTIERLWESYKDNKRNFKGIVTDENRFKNYIKPYFGKKEPKDLLPLDIKRVQNKLLKKRASATVRNVSELLRRIINFGVNNRLCQGIDFKIEMPEVNNLKTEDLTPDELERLLDAIEKDDNTHAGPMMLMALYTGMRRGELFKLKWKHIDFEKGFINLIDPKGTVDQKIPLNDLARELIENHPKHETSEYIFPGRGGQRRVEIGKALRDIREKAGLPNDFRPLHGLRHTFASALASSGKVDMYILQKLMTHKGPAMTQRYAHLRDQALKQGSNIAADIFSKNAVTEKDKVVDMPK